MNYIAHWTEDWEDVSKAKACRKTSFVSADTGYWCNKSRICIPKCMEEDISFGSFPVAEKGCPLTVSSCVLLPSSGSWASNQPVCANLQQTYWWVHVTCYIQTSLFHDLLLWKVRMYEFHLKLYIFFWEYLSYELLSVLQKTTWSILQINLYKSFRNTFSSDRAGSWWNYCIHLQLYNWNRLWNIYNFFYKTNIGIVPQNLASLYSLQWTPWNILHACKAFVSYSLYGSYKTASYSSSSLFSVQMCFSTQVCIWRDLIVQPLSPV